MALPSRNPKLKGARIRGASRFEVALVACFIASVFITLLLLYDTRVRAQHEAELSGLSIVRGLAGDIGHNLQNFQRSLDGAVNALRIPDIWQAPPQLRNAAIFGSSAQVDRQSAMMVLDRTGKVLAISSGLSAPAEGFADRDYFRFHAAHPGTDVHISGPVIGRLVGEPLLLFSRRIDDANGEFDGVVVGGIYLSYFRELFRQSTLLNSAALTLFSSDGQRLVREPSSGKVSGLDARQTPLLRHSTAASSGLFIDRSTYDNVERLVAFSSIVGLPLVLSYARDTSAVFAEWQRTAEFVAASAMILWCAKLVMLARLRRERVSRMAAEQRAWESAAALATTNRTLEERVQREVMAREDASQKLAASQRMEALGQLAGGMAHDFSNVLQSITGACALLERYARNNDEILRLASVIDRSAERGGAVTLRLLAFARRDQLRTEEVDPGALIEDLKELLDHTLGDRIAIETEIPDASPRLAADRMQLETVLINLAINARDAMPAGGTIRIAVSGEPVSPEERAAAGLPDGDLVRISVSDGGVGMDAETLARAGEPFFTTKGIGKGTGLGLAMAKGFAEQSGGGLRIASALGEGTTITLWLPEFHARLPVRAPAREVAAASGAQGREEC